MCRPAEHGHVERAIAHAVTAGGIPFAGLVVDDTGTVLGTGINRVREYREGGHGRLVGGVRPGLGNDVRGHHGLGSGGDDEVTPASTSSSRRPAVFCDDLQEGRADGVRPTP
ncbi:hypothetical protein CA984_35900 [Streptosporangium minutum]|uniref:Uncharacterized protein n=1 Tax=Streptosporangium minutum TaxID=569862 RepID=A0A243R8F9_9ACTN|nr:hypothetical protein CA984_35900 [Streptosporangium minutum]